MCDLSPMEAKILANHATKSNAILAQVLGINVKTISNYKIRIRNKRERALKLIQITNPHKNWLYPKRKGE